MAGPVEWAALTFIGVLLIAAIKVAWNARSELAAYQQAIDTRLSTEKLQFELRIAALERDMRHTKANVKQHGIIYSDMLLDVDRLKAGAPAMRKR